MNDQNLDRLLTSHFAQPVAHQSLPQLQRGVWSGIAARQRPPLLRRLLEGIFPGELRLGPAFAAMVVGISLGYGTLGAPPGNGQYAAAHGLGFDLFSSSYSNPLQKVKL